MQKIIFWLFAILFFFVPLVMWPYTSEVFEFNKMVLVYILTTLIVAAWLTRSVLVKKFIFRRTLLDIPLLIFLGSQILSTIFSIDFATSVFGYYSRFNGGLLSIIAYSLLYWAYVSNSNKDFLRKHLIVLVISSLIASIAAILEHFGVFLTCGMIGSITANCWQQDVQTRVFSTFGQPNWLAAWVAAIFPIAWYFLIKESFKVKNYKFWLWSAASLIFYLTLLFTRSRSGLAGFAIAFIIFWGLYFRQKMKMFDPIFLIFSFSLLAISLVFGTPWTPRIDEIISHKITSTNAAEQGPALETGGTESGTIRKIVWQGALGVWAHYPILGSGVETFAYSYYQFRPVAHNLISEWDFIYNKAHNEYLNYAATTGTLGLLAYLMLIVFSLLQIIDLKSLKILNSTFRFEISDFRFAIIAGYISILVSNFFGFSVVPIEIQFFLFPAFVIVESGISNQESGKKTVTSTQKIFIGATLILASYFLILIFNYWNADLLYAKGKGYDTIGKPENAIPLLNSAIQLEPYQALYYSEISQSYAMVAMTANNQKDPQKTQDNANLAISTSQKSLDLSPANLNIRRTRFGVFIRLAGIDPQFLVPASDTLTQALKLAPTDAKLYYNLGLTQARLGQIDSAITTLEKAIELKGNYKEARLAKALLLINKAESNCGIKNATSPISVGLICTSGLSNYSKASDELNYILEKIDPNDSLTKQTLQSIK